MVASPLPVVFTLARRNTSIIPVRGEFVTATTRKHMSILAIAIGALLAVQLGRGQTSNDFDGDGVPDSADNCWQVVNLDQADADFDGVGDACDPATGTTERVSVDSNGGEADANADDDRVSISANGRFVAWDSVATNLVPGDTNGLQDVFVHDNETGITELVSVSSSGEQGNAFSARTAISADGRFVAFQAAATNLVPDDTNGETDIFVRDRHAGTTERITVNNEGTEADLGSFGASISDDGRFVAFSSSATNLVDGDTNNTTDVFIRDRLTGTTERVSVNDEGVQGNVGSSVPSITPDGRFVAFQSAANNLVPEPDTNGFRDIFVRDRQEGTTQRVNVDSSGNQADGQSESYVLSISADGRFVVFESRATNLVPGDANGNNDVFVRDRDTNSTERISVNVLGTDSDAISEEPAISADGRYVSFHSRATNIVVADTNDTEDLFVRDRDTDQTERVTVSNDGAQADFGLNNSAINADGRFVAWVSGATNLVLGDTNEKTDAFVRSRDIFGDTDGDGVSDAGDNCQWTANDQTDSDNDGLGDICDADSPDNDQDADGVPTNVDNCPLTPNGDQGDTDSDGIGDACDPNSNDGPAGNLDGDAFVNNADNCPLTANDDQADADGDGIGDACDGDPNDGPAGDLDGDDTSNDADNCPLLASADLADADGDSVGDACDPDLGTTERISVNTAGMYASDDSDQPSLSADGRFVAFKSSATDLVPGGTNGATHIFVRDRHTGETRLVSANGDGVQGDGDSDEPAISADGRFVAFASNATNLVEEEDSNNVSDVFIHNLQTHVTERISVDSGESQGNGASVDAAISADGSFVAFASVATNFVDSDLDQNNARDIFVRDRSEGTTERVNVDSAGAESELGSSATSPSISADGNFVAFDSTAANLVSGDANGTWDVFVRDREGGITERMSVDVSGLAAGNGVSFFPSISADGQVVAFSSTATNLVAGDTNGREDIFVRDRQAVATERVSVSSARLQANGASRSFTFAMSAEGRFVAYSSSATNLVTGDTNGRRDIFVFDRLTGTTERVSVAAGGTQADLGSDEMSLSADGRFVAFGSDATNLVGSDMTGFTDVFVRDRVSQTPAGTTVEVNPVDATNGTSGRAIVTFDEVTTPGSTTLATSTEGPTPPAGFSLGEPATYYDISTTAVVIPPIRVCINYTGVSFENETQLRLWHYENGDWVDQTIPGSLDTDANTICARANSLSPFTVLEASDTTAPTLSVTASPATLWPPNHRMITIAVTVAASDETAPVIELISITSDEADSGGGNGDQPNDIQGAVVGSDDRSFALRAERLESGDGRVYTITYRATDQVGNTTVATAVVTVPKNNSGK